MAPNTESLLSSEIGHFFQSRDAFHMSSHELDQYGISILFQGIENALFSNLNQSKTRDIWLALVRRNIANITFEASIAIWKYVMISILADPVIGAITYIKGNKSKMLMLSLANLFSTDCSTPNSWEQKTQAIERIQTQLTSPADLEWRAWQVALHAAQAGKYTAIAGGVGQLFHNLQKGNLNTCSYSIFTRASSLKAASLQSAGAIDRLIAISDFSLFQNEKAHALASKLLHFIQVLAPSNSPSSQTNTDNHHCEKFSYEQYVIARNRTEESAYILEKLQWPLETFEILRYFQYVCTTEERQEFKRLLSLYYYKDRNLTPLFFLFTAKLLIDSEYGVTNFADCAEIQNCIFGVATQCIAEKQSQAHWKSLLQIIQNTAYKFRYDSSSQSYKALFVAQSVASIGYRYYESASSDTNSILPVHMDDYRPKTTMESRPDSYFRTWQLASTFGTKLIESFFNCHANMTKRQFVHLQMNWLRDKTAFKVAV